MKTKVMNNPKGTVITVVNGDITKYSHDPHQVTDAIIINVDSSGEWYTAVDNAIRTIDSHYHDYAKAHLPLEEFDVIVAEGSNLKHPACPFDNVIFVVDNDPIDYEETVYLGLCRANIKGYRAVSLPLFRMSLLRTADTQTVLKAVQRTAKGLVRFLKDKNTTVEIVSFVLLDAPKHQQALKEAIDLELSDHLRVNYL